MVTSIVFGTLVYIIAYVMLSTQCYHSWEDKGDGTMKCRKCKKRQAMTHSEPLNRQKTPANNNVQENGKPVHSILSKSSIGLN
ncbi:MAG: hypothetical protein ACXVNQ_07480 [Bacteroidia bacterium]